MNSRSRTIGTASRMSIVLAAVAAITLSLMYMVRPVGAVSLSTYDLHASQVGTDSSKVADSEDCKDANVPAGQVLWHFILNNLADGTDFGQLTVEFKNAGTVGPQAFGKLTPGGVMMWDVYTTGDDILNGATAEVSQQPAPENENKKPILNLSHVCHGAGTSQSQSPEGSVEAGTGTPAGSQPNTAIGFNGVSPLPTVAFSLILLAALGALAYANVKSARS